MLLATVVGIGAIIWYSSQPTMRVLTSGESSHLMEVEKALEKEGVPYTVEGRKVMVDSGDHARARSALTRNNVSSTTGEDKSLLNSMTSSAEDRAAARLYRLQQQAARALMSMQGVQDARVQASKPRRPVFRANDNESKPRATALIRVTPGASFRRVARSAAATVASTIGLPPENVIIIDMVTQSTFRVDPDLPHSDGSGFRRQERDLEAVYQEKALRLLGPLRDKVRVAVTVFLDPEYKSSRKSFIPPEPVLLEESSTKEDKKGAQRSNGGDPSVTAAVAGNQARPGAGRTTGESTKKSTSDKKYDSDLGTIIEGLLAPKIKKLSVGITIDKSHETEKNEIKAVVMDAIGWEEPRDGPRDQVEPFIIEFPAEATIPLPDPSAGVVVGPSPPTSDWKQYLPLAGQLLGLLLVLLFLRSLLKRSNTAPVPVTVSTAGAGQILEDLDDENLPPDETAKRMRREIEKAISEDPATMSRMLEKWLAEQKA
ncbi:MAG: flagellar M-ring protein FliF C-terminal domain-containing protein [Planctomycetota bacterium]